MAELNPSGAPDSSGAPLNQYEALFQSTESAYKMFCAAAMAGLAKQGPSQVEEGKMAIRAMLDSHQRHEEYVESEKQKMREAWNKNMQTESTLAFLKQVAGVKQEITGSAIDMLQEMPALITKEFFDLQDRLIKARSSGDIKQTISASGAGLMQELAQHGTRVTQLMAGASPAFKAAFDEYLKPATSAAGATADTTVEAPAAKAPVKKPAAKPAAKSRK
jgi:hypothetical protein